MGLQIEQPLFLLLFIPVLGVLFLFWKDNRDTANVEKKTILLMRFITFLLIVFALCMPYLRFPVDGITTIFVMDQSESVKNEQDAMYSAIEQAIEGMSIEDKYAIVTVAEEGQVSQTLSSREKGIVANNILEETSFTNLEEGLQLASSLLSSHTNGRIVLLTDGNENIGDVTRQVELLKNQHIAVDVIPFTSSIEQDVAIDKFEVPSSLYLGENANFSVTLTSTIDTTSRIRITKNNETIIDQEVQVKQGRNAYSFNYLIESSGTHSFQAEIVTDGDGVPQNNEGYAISNVQGTPKVLLVEGTEGEAGNIEAALKASSLEISKTNPIVLPTSLTGYLDFEAIIFSNVSATDVTQEQMEMIESAVRDFGVGFIMSGGNQSFGLGGYFKTPIESLLPVEMDLKGKKELPSLGMIIVMDRSGSMSGYKMDLAKEAAARSVELLRDTDTLGFIAFDDQPWQIIETEPLTDKEEAVEKIRSITEGGGTEIFSSLKLAYEQLEPLDLQRKHIILLTDGQSATNNDYFEVISEGLDSNVTLSTVAIGSDADLALLEQLATEGTGRFYDVQDASTIPSILSRETILTTRTYIEDDPFYPSYFEGSQWSPIFMNGVPEMNAYVATDPKSRAEIVLISEKGDPVLSRWQYGLGNTIAWTSDASGEWSGSWPAWEKWPTLWNEIVTWSLPSYQSDIYDIQQEINGKEVTLTVTSANPELLPLQARMVDEKGNELDAQIRPTAPGKHEVTFEAETGLYYLQISKLENEQITSTFQTGVVVPYSKEFELANQNQTLLSEIADLGEGKILESPEEAFHPMEQDNYERQPIFMQLLLLAFLLFFVEIAIRRFGITSLIEKVKASRKEQVDKHVDQQKNIKQTFDQLKKASTKTVQTKERAKESHKKDLNEPIEQELKRKIEDRNKDNEQEQTNNNDRMKRLLEAKNRKNRGL